MPRYRQRLGPSKVEGLSTMDRARRWAQRYLDASSEFEGITMESFAGDAGIDRKLLITAVRELVSKRQQ